MGTFMDLSLGPFAALLDYHMS